EELGFEDSIDPRLPLGALGLDSLMSVNVANRLERALGTPVPVVKLIRGPSIDELVDDLLPRVTALSDVALSARGNGRGAGNQATNGSTTQAASGPEVAETVTAGGWLVFPGPNPSARVRLFCFPFAGGGATSSRSWAGNLDPAIELVAIEPPGRASRIHEPPLTRLGSLLDALDVALGPFLDKPSAFIGYCLGGLTLFELARRLPARPGVELIPLF